MNHSTDGRSMVAMTEAMMLAQGADLSHLNRISVILNHRYEVLDLWDNVAMADHVCDADDDCCGNPLWYGEREHRILAPVGWVYALGGFDGSIHYVGMTRLRLPVRINQHYQFKDEPHWRRAKKLGLLVDFVAGWNVGDACVRLERAAILALQPPMNTKDVSA